MQILMILIELVYGMESTVGSKENWLKMLSGEAMK